MYQKVDFHTLKNLSMRLIIPRAQEVQGNKKMLVQIKWMGRGDTNPSCAFVLQFILYGPLWKEVHHGVTQWALTLGDANPATARRGSGFGWWCCSQSYPLPVPDLPSFPLLPIQKGQFLLPLHLSTILSFPHEPAWASANIPLPGGDLAPARQRTSRHQPSWLESSCAHSLQHVRNTLGLA